MAAPRATWSGSINLGLISIPVKVYPASKTEKKISFNELNSATKNRIKQKKFDAETGEEVAHENIIKGFEISKDEYVVVDTKELDELLPEKTQSIEIESFVARNEVDPIYFNTPYYAGTQTGAKAYTLLRKALEDTDTVAIGRIVMRTKEHLVAIHPHGEGLAISTLHWDETIRDIEEVTPDEVVIKEEEMKMAVNLIDSMSEEFDPASYTDEHRARVMELIEAKAAGKEVVRTESEEAPDAEPEDLFAALEASLAAGKKPKKTKKAS